MTKKRLQESVRKFSQSKQTQTILIDGELGIPIGGAKVVEVPGRAGFVYVRIRGNQSELIQAYNAAVSPIYGLPVLLARDGNIYKVIGRNLDRYRDWGNTPYLPKHGSQHSFNHELGIGADIVWVYSQQFMPLLAYPSGTAGSMNLVVNPAFYEWNGSWKFSQTTGTPSFTPYLPTGSASAKMTLLYIQPSDNSLQIADGSEFADSITGSAQVAQYIPDISRDVGIPVAAVRLASGTTAITWDAIYDVRDFFTPRGGSSGAGGFGFIAQNEGVILGTGTVLNFVGDNVDATISGSVVRVFVTGSSGAGIENHYLGVYNYLDGSNYKLGLVSSNDARNWNIIQTPVLPLGTAGAFDDTLMAHGSLVQANGVLYLYYGGNNGSVWRIGLARSYDKGLTWTKETGTVLAPTQGWENNVNNEVNYPKVLYDREESDSNKRFKMWYNGGEYGAGGIGYAYSADGISWTKSSSNPVLTKAGSGWESFYLSPGAVVRKGDTYILFFSSSATSAGAYAAGYATFTNPEGTYTKSPSNPIIGGDGIVSALSATVNINDTQATVANANLFPIGAPVWVHDASARYLTTVKSRSSATVLNFDNAAPVQITTTSGTVRTASYNSITIESALFDGGWLFSISPFQPGIGGGIVHETSMLAWGNLELNHVWIDYGAGLAVPFPVADTTANQVSRENLNFIDIYDMDDRFRPVVATGSASVPASSPGIFGLKNGVPLGTGTSINVTGNLDFTLSGTVLNLSSPITTYFRVGQPTTLSSHTGTFWRVPDGVYASGSLGVFNNGHALIPGIDYAEQLWVSGTYQYLLVQPTGTYHLVHYGVPCSPQIQPPTGSVSQFWIQDSDSVDLHDSDDNQILDTNG